jgi:hypothetical protein
MGMVPGGFETLGLQAAFEGIFPFQQVGGQMAQGGQIFRGMVFWDAAVVFPKRDFQAPVQTVFDPSVFSAGLGGGGSRRLGPGVGAADEGAQGNHVDIVKQVPVVGTPGVLEAVGMLAAR